MRTASSIALPCALLLLSGCSGNWGTATGTVTLDGNRMTKGMVTFHASGGGADAYAQINPDGTFQAMTGSDRGLKVGDYTVTVVDQTIPAGLGEMVKILTPPKYASPATSDLKATIKPGGNAFDFILTK